MVDPISDMLTRIRNAQAVSKKIVDLPFSKMKFALAKVLKKNKYIKKVEKITPSELNKVYFSMPALPRRQAGGRHGRKAQKIEKKGNIKFNILRIVLKYDAEKQPVMEHIKRISKSGKRIYKKSTELKPVRQGYGKLIISTSKGLMTDAEARKNKLGGEVICEIW